MQPPFGAEDVRDGQPNPCSVRNQRMTLYGKLRQSNLSKRNTMIALRGYPRGVFHHSSLDKGVWRRLP